MSSSIYALYSTYTHSLIAVFVIFLFLDIVECDTPGICSAFANCTNSEGSYECTCKEGFTGDGKTCQGKNNVLFITLPYYKIIKNVF